MSERFITTVQATTLALTMSGADWTVAHRDVRLPSNGTGAGVRDRRCGMDGATGAVYVTAATAFTADKTCALTAPTAASFGDVPPARGSRPWRPPV